MRYRIVIAAAVLPLLATACNVDQPASDSSHSQHRAKVKAKQKAEKAAEKAKAEKQKDKAKAQPLAAAPTRQPKPSSAPVYYVNCDEVRAAGAAPIRRGDPGYASHLDRDGDGVGCED